MFCPNCGSRNGVDQNYCRSCGLKLDAVVNAIAEQFPSEEFVDMLRRRETFHRIGMLCLSIAGFVGFALLLFKAAQYKAELFGPEVLFWSAIGALVSFLLLSVFFFNYANLGVNIKPTVPDKNVPATTVTTKLIEDRPFEPAVSVTESTTDILKAPMSQPDRDHRKE